MNKFDREIISILSHSGRISWTQLAEKISLSPSACQRRVEALINEGVISKFTIAVDPHSVGLGVKALVSVNVERGDTQNTDAFRQALITHPRIQSAHMVSGSIDYMLEVYATDLEDLCRFLDEELLKMPAVRDATSSIVLSVIKPHEPVTA